MFLRDTNVSVTNMPEMCTDLFQNHKKMYIPAPLFVITYAYCSGRSKMTRSLMAHHSDSANRKSYSANHDNGTAFAGVLLHFGNCCIGRVSYADYDYDSLKTFLS